MGKHPESTACMSKKAASVLLKMFINANERCHTPAFRSSQTEAKHTELVFNSTIPHMLK